MPKLTTIQSLLLSHVRAFNDKGECSPYLPKAAQLRAWELLEKEGLITHVCGDLTFSSGWVVTDHPIVGHVVIQTVLQVRIREHERKLSQALAAVQYETKTLDGFRKLLRCVSASQALTRHNNDATRK